MFQRHKQCSDEKDKYDEHCQPVLLSSLDARLPKIQSIIDTPPPPAATDDPITLMLIKCITSQSD